MERTKGPFQKLLVSRSDGFIKITPNGVNKIRVGKKPPAEITLIPVKLLKQGAQLHILGHKLAPFSIPPNSSVLDHPNISIKEVVLAQFLRLLRTEKAETKVLSQENNALTSMASKIHSIIQGEINQIAQSKAEKGENPRVITNFNRLLHIAEEIARGKISITTFKTAPENATVSKFILSFLTAFQRRFCKPIQKLKKLPAKKARPFQALY